MLRKSKILSLLLCFCLLFEQTGFAQVVGTLDVSGHITAFRNQLIPDKFRPLHLRSLGYDNAQNSFRLLLDKGDLKNLKKLDLEVATKTLLNYFFVGITLPNDAFWVNLRPDSENNIIDSDLATTDVGKILLEADLQLKKDTANFTSPEIPEGKEYWDKLYQKAGELLGYENITIPTLTRPWIVPGEIIIRETKDNAYIYKATLKVMLEQDYLKDSATYNFDDSRLKTLNEYSSQLIRDLIIPKLSKEINTSQRYAPLRQVYYSLILAQWFKSRFCGKGGLYPGLIDRRGLQGLTSKSSWFKTTYFKAYQKSFKNGEYNIQKPVYASYGKTIRSYFSGGSVWNVPMPATPTPGIVSEITEGPTKVIVISGDVEHNPLPRTGNIVGALAVGGNTMDSSEAEVTIIEGASLPSGLPVGGFQSGASSVSPAAVNTYVAPGTRKFGDGYTLEIKLPSDEEKYILGKEKRYKFIDYLHETIGLIDEKSPELNTAYREVKEVIDILLKAAGLNPDYFIFHFVDSLEPNAFVLRYSNHLFVNVGLIDYLISKGGTKDALAFVLAHEITHLAQFRSDVDAGKARLPEDLKDVAETYVASYGDEYDADWRALKLLERVYEMTNGQVHFSIGQATFLFNRLNEDLQEDARRHPDRSEWDRLKTKFGTHPQLKERIRNLEKIMNSLYWRSYFIQLSPFSEAFTKEVQKKTRTQKFRQDIKDMRTITDFKDLLNRVTNLNELEFLVIATYEKTKNHGVNFSFRDAFDLADNKADDLIRETPELLPYYFFIFTSLARFPGYTRIDYDKHKQVVKEKLQDLTFEQLHDLLKIQLPPILSTNTKTEYFEYKYTFYGLTGSNGRDSRQARFENFMEIWIDALMEEIEQRIENRPLSIQEVFDLESALEMHRQRGKQVRPTLMETWRQYFPGNRALFHVYNFDITWYLWNRIKEDPQGNKQYIQKFIDRLNVLALSQGGGSGGGYRQEALTMSGSIRANRYQEMLDGLRQLMDQGLVTKEQYLNFVINKGGKYSKELVSEYRRKEIDNFPQGNLLTFAGTDIDRDFEVFMRMFSSAEEYFSKDIMDMMDKLAAYYGLSTTDRLDFIERSYKKINAAWFAQGTEKKKVIDEDEEGTAESVEQEDTGKKASEKQESLYFLGGFHDYLRNAIFSLKQTPEIEEFLTNKMHEIEREKHVTGLSSLSFQMKRLIYLYHVGSGIHPWTLKLLLFGRDEDNGYMLTTYAIDFSAVREAEGATLREKEMGKDLGFGETSKLKAKEQQARAYGKRNVDKIEELIRGGARFWDKEKTALQLTPEQLAKMPKGTVLKSIRAEQRGDYNYVTVGEDQFRQDAKRKTYIWYDTFAGVPVDPFLYEYSDSSKVEEEKDRGYGIAGAKRIDAHPLYGVQFSNQDLEGFYRYLSALPTKQGPGKFPSMEDFDARNVFHEIGDIDTWDEYIAAIGIQSFLRRQGVNTVNRGLQPRVFDAGEYENVPSYYKAFVGELFELPGLEGIGFFGFRSHGKMAEQYRQFHGEGPTPHVLLRQHFNDGPVDEMFKEAFGFINELKGSLPEKVDYLIKGLPPSVFRNFALYALFLNDVLQVALKNKGKSFDMRKALEPKYIENFIKSNFSFDEQMPMLNQAELVMRHIVWDKRLDAANRKNLIKSVEKAVRVERLITHDEELARERNAEREAASLRGGSNRDNPEYVYVPENFSSTGYTPYQYYVAGGVEAHIEFILPHMFSGTFEAIFKDKTLSLEEKIRHFKNLYPRTSQLSDQHLDNILTNTQLQPEEIKKLLPLFSNESLRQKYALKALELERDLYNGRFVDADYELERILYYFPEFGYTRDDILGDFINRKITNPKQLKQAQAYLLQFEDNVRRQETRNRIFGRDIFKTIFEDYAFGEEQKKEFLLWVLGFTDKKPDFLIIIEHDYHINFDSMRSGTVVSDTKYYKDIGRSAFEDVLSSFLFGEKGILTNEETRSSFLTTIFNSMVPDTQGRREANELAREIFLSVFEHASEVRQEQLLKRLFVSMKKTVSGKKLSVKELEAKGIRVFLESIGFAGVKLGQFIQSAFELPEHISSELQKLKEEAELLPKGVAFQVLDSVFGDFYEVFDSLDEVIGRASLKVVYRARLKDERQVVVKLKRPDVEKRIEEEMKLMSDVLSSVERNLRQQGIVLPQNMIPRIRGMIESELDFNREYANQGELRENIKAREAKEAASRSQPKGIGGLISKFVTPSKYSIKIPNSTEVKNNMVMIEEEVNGFSLDKTDELVKSGVDPKEAKAAALEELLKEIFIDGFYHADPHAGNILVSSGYQMSFIDLGLMGRLSPENQKIIFSLILYANKNSIRYMPFLASILGVGSAQDIVNLLQQIAGGETVGISTRKVESIAASSENTAEKLLKFFRLIEDSGVELPAEFIILSKTLGTAGYLFHDMSLVSVGRVLISIRKRPWISAEDSAIDLEGLKINKAERGESSELGSQQRGTAKETPGDLSSSGASEFDKVQTQVSEVDKKGGIDFRALPIVNQQIDMGMLKLSHKDLNKLSNINLDSEWIVIQNMVNAGIIPSSERIKEYVLVSCLRQNLGNQIDKVLGCIADILRMKEDRVEDVDVELKDMLVLIEAGKPETELQCGLSQIKISSQEPKARVIS